MATAGVLQNWLDDFDYSPVPWNGAC
jgi:hypothetical protein